MSERISLAKLREWATGGWRRDLPLTDAVVALIDLADAAADFVGDWDVDDLDRLEAALARFDFRDAP